MKRYKCITEYFVPVGTILILTPQFDMLDKEVCWVYEYSFVKDGVRKFGDLSIRDVEERPQYFELINE